MKTENEIKKEKEDCPCSGRLYEHEDIYDMAFVCNTCGIKRFDLPIEKRDVRRHLKLKLKSLENDFKEEKKRLKENILETRRLLEGLK